MRTIKCAINGIIVLMFVSLIAVPVASTEETLDGTAEVLSAAVPPEVLSVVPSEAAWDPGTEYTITATVRDTNTLDDLENVVVMAYESSLSSAYPDSARNHYTWWYDPADSSWHGEGIDGDSCSAPGLSATEGEYVFAVSLEKTAQPGNWDIYAKAKDKGSLENSLEEAEAIMVNVYTEFELDSYVLNFSGMQGETVEADENPLIVAVTTNEDFDVQVRMAGPWTCDGLTMLMETTTANGITLTDSYKDIYTGVVYGEGVEKAINWALAIPPTQKLGTYSATFYVNVVRAAEVNLSPVADANGPYTVNEGETVELDGTGSSDPDGTIESYLWTIVDDPTGEAILTDETTATPTFNAPEVGENTVVTVELTVTDNGGLTNSDTASVKVVNVEVVNQSPVADANGPYEVDEGGTVLLDGTGSSDPDGTIASYYWAITSGPGSLTDANTATPMFHAPDVEDNTVVTVHLTVEDDDGAIDSATAVVTIMNMPPRVLTVGEGEGYDYQTIYEAIEAARPGDTVLVYPGIYDNSIENFPITVDVEGLTIRSVKGPEDTVILGDTTEGGIHIVVDGVTIGGFRVENCDYGIFLDSSSNSTVENNVVISNGGHGIWLKNSSNSNTIRNNVVSNGQEGIALSQGCCNNAIENNVVTSNVKGIFLGNSSNNTIRNNVIASNGEKGIYLDKSSNNNAIENNVIASNAKEGIFLGGKSSNNTIENNTIENNLYGVWNGYNCPNNSIHHNNIVGNTDLGVKNLTPLLATVHAENNWWGDPTGPFHETSNPDGKGDAVSDGVEFAPWLDAPYPGGEPNYPPVADADGPYTVNENESIVLSGENSNDTDEAIVSYLWTIVDDPTGAAYLTDNDTATPTFHAPLVGKNTVVTVSLTVTDDDGAKGSDTATVTVVDTSVLVTGGDGTAEWTTEQAHSGSYSVKLTAGAIDWTDWAGVQIPYGKMMDTFSTAYFYYNIENGVEGQVPIMALVFENDGETWKLVLAPELPTWETGTGTWKQLTVPYSTAHLFKEVGGAFYHWTGTEWGAVPIFEELSWWQTSDNSPIKDMTVDYVEVSIGTKPATVYVDDIRINPNPALDFDGVDDYVGQSGVMADTMPVTISLWFKWTGIESDFDVLAGAKGKSAAVVLRINTGAKNEPVGTYNWSSWSPKRPYDKGLMDVGSAPTGTWTHLVAVAGPAGGENVHYLLYQDGELVAKTTDVRPAPSCPIWIGAQYDGPFVEERYFNGSIDDVRVYNRALSAGEVENLYNGMLVSDENLLAWWKFDEGSGLIAHDSSGNNNNGTIHGATWVER